MLTRGSKGAALTWSELDANFIELDTGKVNKTGSDLTGPVNANKGADIASAAAINLGAATGEYVVITGSVGISSLGTAQAGTERNVVFTGSLTLTHNATSLILPGGSNITTAAGDTATFRSEGAGNWRCTGYQPNINGLKLGGTAARITGDFSSTPLSNRVMFQTSVANGNTYVGAMPNGTSTNSNFSAFSASDPTNSSITQLSMTGVEARLSSSIIGSGTYLPMTFYTGGAERMRIDASGNVGVGGASSGARLEAMGSATASLATLSTSDAATVSINNLEGSALGRTSKLLFRNGGLNLAAISGVYTAFNGPGDVAGILSFGTQATAAGGVLEKFRIDQVGNALVTTAGGGLGYGVGAGGTVTQSTSKSTAVTLNKPCGQITMNNAALAAGAEVGFAVSNTLVSLNDSVLISPSWATVNPNNYQCRLNYVGGGSFGISVKNISAGSLSEALVINFAIIKGSAS